MKIIISSWISIYYYALLSDLTNCIIVFSLCFSAFFLHGPHKVTSLCDSFGIYCYKRYYLKICSFGKIYCNVFYHKYLIIETDVNQHGCLSSSYLNLYFRVLPMVLYHLSWSNGSMCDSHDKSDWAGFRQNLF